MFSGQISFLGVCVATRERLPHVYSSAITGGFCYATFMRTATVALVLLIPCWMALIVGLPARATSAEISDPRSVDSAAWQSDAELLDLSIIIDNFPRVPRENLERRRIAQATFCLPQNVLGALFYGLLQLTGSVVNTADVNEIKIVVTTAPVGVSLGRFIFIHTSLQTENAIRHEYGHTLQGYKHGPFYLLLEGVVSFTQCTLSLLSPSFAEHYFDRWPENEANELGGVSR